mmetsp:Transcript_56541/g.132622  ORF Transcript_56541/g.132622 Transcript_56541/m.132622 type:complete len:306 (-) Transcript_56541:79-996(-)
MCSYPCCRSCHTAVFRYSCMCWNRLRMRSLTRHLHLWCVSCRPTWPSPVGRLLCWRCLALNDCGLLGGLWRMRSVADAEVTSRLAIGSLHASAADSLFTCGARPPSSTVRQCWCRKGKCPARSARRHWSGHGWFRPRAGCPALWQLWWRRWRTKRRQNSRKRLAALRKMRTTCLSRSSAPLQPQRRSQRGREGSASPLRKHRGAQRRPSTGAEVVRHPQEAQSRGSVRRLLPRHANEGAAPPMRLMCHAWRAANAQTHQPRRWQRPLAEATPSNHRRDQLGRRTRCEAGFTKDQVEINWRSHLSV